MAVLFTFSTVLYIYEVHFVPYLWLFSIEVLLSMYNFFDHDTFSQKFYDHMTPSQIQIVS